jgi:integrase
MIKVKELSPKTAKNVNAVIQTIFNYAIKNEYTEKNPATHVIIPKFDNKYNITLTTEQIKDLITNIINFDNPMYKLIFIFALHGRRKNEILKMQYYQLDLDADVYFIPPQKNKAKKYDIHEMTPLLLSELSVYLKSKPNIKKNDYLFFNEDTNNHIKDVRRPFEKLKKLSNISNMRFHDFRHLLGTESVKKGVPIEHISQALGHSSIEVTQRYITKDSSISSKVVKEFLDPYFQDKVKLLA